MGEDFRFVIRRTPFDANYKPASNTRITTNFANLARGERREENLSNALGLMNTRFNALARWDNPEGERYGLGLEIITAELHLDGGAKALPVIEMLATSITDHQRGTTQPGMVGNSFSSYVRDHDFAIRLKALGLKGGTAGLPEDFGVLHGNLYRAFVGSEAWAQAFHKLPVICLSVSSSEIYHATDTVHPILGQEYRQEALSLTDVYFSRMGLGVRFFMPRGSVAPLAFYCAGDLTGDYTSLELASAISVMETFQKIYRPEIYAAHRPAGARFKPSLSHRDFTPTGILYDRDERSRLGVEQAHYADEVLMRPHQAALTAWASAFSL